MMKHTVLVEEARKILGADATETNDEDIRQVIPTLHALTSSVTDDAATKLQMRKDEDVKDFASLIYDIYQDKKKQ